MATQKRGLEGYPQLAHESPEPFEPAAAHLIVASLQAAVATRDQEIERLHLELRLFAHLMKDVGILMSTLVEMQSKDAAKRRQPVDLDQNTINAIGAAGVLAAIEGAGG